MGDMKEKIMRPSEYSTGNITTARTVVILLTLALLAGCGTSKVVINDDQTPPASFRVALNLDDGSRPATSVHTGHVIELGYARMSGEGRQTLAAGQDPIIFNHVTFLSLQSVVNTFDLGYGDIS